MAAGDVGGAEARVELEGRVVVGDRAGEIARGVSGTAAAVVERSRGVPERPAQDLIVVGHGALVIPQEISRRGPILIDRRRGRAGPVLQGLVEVGDGPGHVPLACRSAPRLL